MATILHNGLVGVFLRYVDSLKPLMFLMENVQGILWTPQSGKSSTASVMAHLARRCAAMGYIVFPKLLDAVWYGVPQHRSRFSFSEFVRTSVILRLTSVRGVPFRCLRTVQEPSNLT